MDIIRLFFPFVVAVLMLAGAPVDSSAQGSGKKISLVRDAETENTIRQMATPLLIAANLRPADLKVHLVLDDRLNAFVAGGQRIFINTGLLRKTDSHQAVIGVMAHEIGHISGGHLAQVQKNLRNASAQSILFALLGAAAAVASGDPEAAIAGVTIGQSVGERDFLKYNRSMESQADRAALRYLEDSGQSASGLLDVLEMLQDQELMVGGQQDPYLRSHPLSQDRLATVREHIGASRFSDAPVDPNLAVLYRRIRGKLNGYVDPPERTFANYSAKDKDIEARYARIQAFIKLNRTGEALEVVDRLIELSPKDPFFHELKGDIYMNAGRIRESLPSFRAAVTHSGGHLPLLRISLARALLEIEGRETAAEALQHLKPAVRHEPGMPRSWRLLATAYGRTDDIGAASYALAEEGLLLRDRKAVEYNVARALQYLPPDSPLRERVIDIRNLFKPDKKKKAGEDD